mgnify:CR=1 FL=1
MKKTILLTLALFILGSEDVEAQCAMCRAVLESGADQKAAESLNDDYIVMHLDTSNHNYAIHPLSTANNSATYKAMTGSLIVDMDANDTAHVTVFQAFQSAQLDIHVDSRFSGFLVT